MLTKHKVTLFQTILHIVLLHDLHFSFLGLKAQHAEDVPYVVVPDAWHLHREKERGGRKRLIITGPAMALII